jgi:hypothetical protein
VATRASSFFFSDRGHRLAIGVPRVSARVLLARCLDEWAGEVMA